MNKSINETIHGKRKEWKKIHEKKLDKLFSEKPTTTNYSIRPTENIIHNFLSYVFTAV